VKRLPYAALVLMVALLCWYAFEHPEKLGFDRSASFAAAGTPAEDNVPPARPNQIVWQPVDRSADGFNVEMPQDTRPLRIPAYNESGATEPVNMIFASPDGGTTYAVAWADNPPSMRIARHSADATLDAARDGLLARTQTTLITETRCRPQGFDGRDILARNVGGGVLDARLIFVGQRLYLLTAAYPSMAARRAQDVQHFIGSFAVAEPPRH
jgi:hypothetical protein